MPTDRETAERLIEERYGDWSHDDPEWWRDMIEFVMDYESIEAAIAWLDGGPP